MILGIDPGERRVGVAAADLETRIAHPVEVIDRRATDAASRIAELVAEREVSTVVVGRPTGLSGNAGPAVTAQQELVAELRTRLGVEVVEYDERFTTTIADRALVASGAKRHQKKEMRDAIAAQLMLQGYLDAEKARSLWP